MQELDEGFIDFLKKLWRSIVGRKDPNPETDYDTDLPKKTDVDPGYSAVEDLRSSDPLIKQKLARIFVRGLRLHQEAQRFGIPDQELMKIISGVWTGKLTLNDFFKLKQSGVVDRIYARVRERVRYQRRKRGVWHENKNN